MLISALGPTVFLMSDLEMPVRGRTYREPKGPHILVVRGRDLETAIEHLQARSDCSAIAIIGLTGEIPDMKVLTGRRLLLMDGDPARLRDFAEAALHADVDAEWVRAVRPSTERLAAWALPVGAVVLAAGTSSRMHGPQKLLLEVDGKPLVRHAAEAASEGGCHQVVVVYASKEVQQAIGGSVETVRNPHAESGMASSMRVGLRALRPEMVAALVVLGDQPLVGSRTVATVLRSWRREGSRQAVAVAAGDREWSPPVVLSKELWPHLIKLTGDAGARQILKGHPELLDIVPAPGRLDDIDTPEDFAKIVRLFPKGTKA